MLNFGERLSVLSSLNPESLQFLNRSGWVVSDCFIINHVSYKHLFDLDLTTGEYTSTNRDLNIKSNSFDCGMFAEPLPDYLDYYRYITILVIMGVVIFIVIMEIYLTSKNKNFGHCTEQTGSSLLSKYEYLFNDIENISVVVNMRCKLEKDLELYYKEVISEVYTNNRFSIKISMPEKVRLFTEY